MSENGSEAKTQQVLEIHTEKESVKKEMSPFHTRGQTMEGEIQVSQEMSQDKQDVQLNDKLLDEKLDEAVKCYKTKNFDEAENIFSDLMVNAVKFYQSETHHKMSKFFFFYGDMLLSKLENNPDVFGEQAQKKITPNNNPKEEEDHDDDVDNDNDEEQEEGVKHTKMASEDAVTQQIVQLDTVIFKDENVVIRDETKDCGLDVDIQQQQKNDDEKTVSIVKVSVEPSDPIDDLQLSWEHLELSRKIYNLELTFVENSDGLDTKNKSKQIIEQIIEVTLRIGDLESWRDNLTEAAKEYAKAVELSKTIEDKKYSRNLSSAYFQLGNALLYENKEFCEDDALRNFVDSAQIMENCLSLKISVPAATIPSFKMLKKENISTNHLKHSFLDDDESKQIKDTLKHLYEKIEDTLIQREDRDKYKIYQEQMKQQALLQNQFAQPAQSNVPVKNLGTFGSLKRKDPIDSMNGSSSIPQIQLQNNNHTLEQQTNQIHEQPSTTQSPLIVQMNSDGSVDKMIKKM